MNISKWLALVFLTLTGVGFSLAAQTTTQITLTVPEICIKLSGSTGELIVKCNAKTPPPSDPRSLESVGFATPWVLSGHNRSSDGAELYGYQAVVNAQLAELNVDFY
jgi:hypothetical protein